MNAVHWVLLALAVLTVVPAIRLLDRLGLWLESRGLLFYRHKKPGSSPISALTAVQQFLEPGAVHLVRAAQDGRHVRSREASRLRLLNLVRTALVGAPCNPEVLRVYLAQAKAEGLDWAELYQSAVEAAHAAASTGGLRIPTAQEVAPD